MTQQLLRGQTPVIQTVKSVEGGSGMFSRAEKVVVAKGGTRSSADVGSRSTVAQVSNTAQTHVVLHYHKSLIPRGRHATRVMLILEVGLSCNMHFLAHSLS